MANIQIFKGVSSVTRESDDGSYMPARGTRDGVLFTADWYDALALEGRCFIVNSGYASSPETYAGAYDADTMDLAIDIPDGIIAIPLYIQVTFETASTGVIEVMALASGVLTAVTAGEFTAIYAKNLRIDQPIKSMSTCYGGVDSNDATDPHSGDYFEFFRSGYPTNVALTKCPTPTYIWSARVNGPPPMIVDGGSICVWANAAGATSTGFITAIWAELPENFIK